MRGHDLADEILVVNQGFGQKVRKTHGVGIQFDSSPS